MKWGSSAGPTEKYGVAAACASLTYFMTRRSAQRTSNHLQTAQNAHTASLRVLLEHGLLQRNRTTSAATTIPQGSSSKLTLPGSWTRRSHESGISPRTSPTLTCHPSPPPTKTPFSEKSLSRPGYTRVGKPDRGLLTPFILGCFSSRCRLLDLLLPPSVHLHPPHHTEKIPSFCRRFSLPSRMHI